MAPQGSPLPTQPSVATASASSTAPAPNGNQQTAAAPGVWANEQASQGVNVHGNPLNTTPNNDAQNIWEQQQRIQQLEHERQLLLINSPQGSSAPSMMPGQYPQQVGPVGQAPKFGGFDETVHCGNL